MVIDNRFCEEVLAEYAQRFTEDEIKNGYKGSAINTARIALEVFRLALEKLSREELPNC